MALKVIGTGFGRTGTESMRNALNILGVGPTHHMFELGEDSPLRPLWLDLAKGGKPDWEKLFEGYSACVDWPSAFYWRTLINVYPEAKVILTMRSAESWWKSFEATLLKYLQSGDDPQGLSHLLVAQQVFDGRYADREHAIEVYNKNVADVIATVSPERLLVHNLGDGWGPLCDWLGLPLPDVDYPSGNTTSDMRARFVVQGIDLA
ncbi:MAG: sulfotransferase family protein [Rhodobacteraceae bacterium]|nr:sulfotransferase family protein [Paracoccaceae bacterium]